jgi:predicted regulator of Ras-like GTPase activity (Roadblock/LC7/MglB family)
MAGIRDQLGDMIKVDGITTAVVVGRDGFVIEGVTGGGRLDTEAVGAVISTGIGSSEVMGRELRLGDMAQAMMEYKDGIIVMTLLGDAAVLAVVADLKANLGNIRFQVKKRAPDILRTL